ncbi:MAG: hypothetical protein K2X82_03085 [Gemmataceae bacterium]|nr:hypothetical protein [Gemmataceae bacterium]
MSLADQELVHGIDLGNFEVVWAGPAPAGRPGLSFGSEDGELLLTDEAGRPAGPPVAVAASREAVNGVAAWGDFLAVSTRADVTVWSGLGDETLSRKLVVPFGAHGLSVTGGGVFVAPAGRLGWLLVDPGTGSVTAAGAGPNGDRRDYFYESVVLRDGDGRDVLACAMRTGGVGLARLPDPGQPFRLHSVPLPSFDAVDVCGLGRSLAMAVAGRDGTIVFSPDALTGGDAQSRNLDAVRGDVYRLLACRGHLVVLTSEALYVLLGVVTEFLAAPAAGPGPTRVFSLPVTAVDAHIAADRYILVVTDDNVVLRVDLEAVAAGASAGSLNGAVHPSSAAVANPRWATHGRELASSVLAAV